MLAIKFSLIVYHSNHSKCYTYVYSVSTILTLRFLFFVIVDMVRYMNAYYIQKWMEIVYFIKNSRRISDSVFHIAFPSYVLGMNEWFQVFLNAPPPSPPSFSGGVFSGTFLFLCLAVWLIHLSVALLAKQTQFECLLTTIFFLLILVVCGCTKKNFISLRVH